ncbi:MAG: MFS transporter [Nanoarchaeota archaeon]|nr:MFS transporter [Nanoarchaeota archaeon]
MHLNHDPLWWRFFPRKELTQVYLSTAIRSFALSLLSLFVPLYFYVELQYPLAQTLLFYIYFALALGIASPFAAAFAARYGMKHSVMVSVPLYLGFIFLLYRLPFSLVPLFVLGMLSGVAIAFYWIGMHLVFVKASDHQHRGEEVSLQMVFSILASLLGPLLGGFLIVAFGFPVVFAASSFFLLLSAVVLFSSKEKHVPYHFSWRSLLQRSDWRNALFFISQGSRATAEGTIWPLFIFFILGNYFSLGVVGSILSGVSALVIWFMGRYSDHTSKRKIIWLATGFESISWFLRALVRTTLHVFGVTIFGALTLGFLAAPLGALVYDKGQRHAAAYFVQREMFISLGRILVLLLVLLTDNLAGGLIFNGFANLATLLF